MTKTVRQVTINEAYTLCAAKNLRLKITYHFLERINVRSVRQDETFISFLRAVRFMVSRPDFLERKPDGEHPVIAIQIGSENFFMKVDTRELICMTYFINDDPAVFADRRFKLKETT